MKKEKRIVYRKRVRVVEPTEAMLREIEEDAKIYSLFTEEEIEEYNRLEKERMEADDNDPDVEIVYL